MTALNLIVQQSAGASYLLTDTARYDSAGTVVEFRSKVVRLRVGWRCVVALAATGIASAHFFARHYARLRARTLEDLLAATPNIFRAVEREMIEAGARETCGSGYIGAALAAYDHDAARPVGFVIANGNGLLPVPYRPYSLAPANRYLTRFKGAPFEAGTDLCSPREWTPSRDALALIEAQRRDSFGLAGNEHFAVGGEAVLTTIDAHGVRQRVLTRWPDRVGHRIVPENIAA